MLFTIEFALADRDNRAAAKLTDLNLFTVVYVFRVFFAVEIFFFDRNDFVARQVADLDLLTVVYVFRVAVTVKLILFDRNDFVCCQVADLDVLVLIGCKTPDRITAVLNHRSDKLAITVKPDECFKVIVEEAVADLKHIVCVAVNCVWTARRTWVARITLNRSSARRNRLTVNDDTTIPIDRTCFHTGTVYHRIIDIVSVVKRLHVATAIVRVFQRLMRWRTTLYNVNVFITDSMCRQRIPDTGSNRDARDRSDNNFL